MNRCFCFCLFFFCFVLLFFSYTDRLEYLKESWRPKEICCHSDTIKRPPANTGVRKLVKNEIIKMLFVQARCCPVGRSCKIYRLYCCREVKLPLANECSGYDTKLHLMVRLQSWSFGEYGVPLHCHYAQVHFDPEW